MNLVQTQQKSAFESLKGEFAYKNMMQSPRVKKVVISTGTGKIKDKGKIAVIEDRLARITGQKIAPRGAKKSIAAFKVRQGDVVGYQVTIRGARMYDFLEKLVHVALPRTRDFRGIKPSAIDEMGNLTIGIKEHTIFPETSDEDLKDVFGFAVTIGSTAIRYGISEAFYRHLGFPLQK